MDRENKLRIINDNGKEEWVDITFPLRGLTSSVYAVEYGKYNIGKNHWVKVKEPSLFNLKIKKITAMLRVRWLSLKSGAKING